LCSRTTCATYLAKGIAAAHGGSLNVDSIPGHGASFAVEFPPAKWRQIEMQLYQSVLEPADRDDACDWRTLTLGIAALLAQMTEQQEDVLTKVARQLKAPVATLRAQAARLEDQASAGRCGADVARRIVEQADVMSEWVAAILDLQRIRLGKLPLDIQDVDLVEVARECADDVHTSPGTGQVRVHGDAARLRQALHSVLERVARRVVNSAIELRVEVKDSRAFVCVGDAEQPVCAEDQPPTAATQRAFDLDLYVARELLRLHGGELWSDQLPNAAVVVLPLDFSFDSHTVLASSTACCPRT
jgi:signal transduction histidine kinase